MIPERERAFIPHLNLAIAAHPEWMSARPRKDGKLTQKVGTICCDFVVNI